MSVLNRCAESGCPAHRTSTTPDRMPTRQELLDPTPDSRHRRHNRPADPTQPSGDTR